jgi:hypothetical protein
MHVWIPRRGIKMKNRLPTIALCVYIIACFALICHAEPEEAAGGYKGNCIKRGAHEAGILKTDSDIINTQYCGMLEEGEEPEEDLEEKDGLIHAKALHKKMLLRTEDYYDKVDNLIYKLNALALQAQAANEHDRADELCLALIDYNSFLSDLGLMREVLNMSAYIENDKFHDYFDSMARCYDSLKRGFNHKNELFLSRLGVLKNENILQDEKELIGLYRDYFLYDLWHEQMKSEDNAGKKPEA